MALVLLSIVQDWGSQNSNTLIQIRNGILTVILLSYGVTLLWRAFSKKATEEDIAEKNNERNHLIRYKIKARMSDITFGVLFVLMTCGMIGYKMTANIIWFVIFLVLSVLFGLLLIIEFFVKLFYETRE